MIKDFKSLIFIEGSPHYVPRSYIHQHFGIKTSVSFLAVDRFSIHAANHFFTGIKRK